MCREGSWGGVGEVGDPVVEAGDRDLAVRPIPVREVLDHLVAVEGRAPVEEVEPAGGAACSPQAITSRRA